MANVGPLPKLTLRTIISSSIAEYKKRKFFYGDEFKGKVLYRLSKVALVPWGLTLFLSSIPLFKGGPVLVCPKLSIGFLRGILVFG